jgi:manganese/zinc/iron transport system permease protein
MARSLSSAATIEWPTLAEIATIMTLQGGYNTTVVLIGTTLLGIAAGTVGTFTLLRKRALVTDALSHATLPGIALAFILAVLIGIEARSMAVLLTGAVISGAFGVLLIQLMVRSTRLSEDAAIGVVLGSLFGLGAVLLSYIQSLPTGNQAGISAYILGQPAAMNQGEAWAIGMVAAAAVIATALLFKEFRVLCFDQDYAAAGGLPIFRLDLAMMALVVVVTVIGLKTVGLILIVALVIVPPAAARFWTERLAPMIVIAAAIGGASGFIGATLSALLSRMPAGGIIVLVAGAFFLISLLFAPRRGLLADVIRRSALRLRIAEQRHLRALIEGRTPPPGTVLTLRLRLLGLTDGDGRLSARGRARALAVARNQRLWEAFMHRYPELAPSGVIDAIEPIERVLPADLVAEIDPGAAPRAS